jgi:hypothetical protein
MKRDRVVFGILAALLAVLLPLEQARCAWMTLEHPAARARAHAAADHSCCAHSKSPARHASTLPACCETTPPAALTTHHFASTPPATALVLPLPEAGAGLDPGFTRAPVVALDIGSPPLPDDAGAHGLRAPPLSA